MHGLLSPARALAAALLLLLVALVVVAAQARAAIVPSGFSEQIVFSGLDQPTNIEFAPDGRVFVAEKSGLIKVFDTLDDTTPTVFADLRTKVHNYWDRGLLGLALHPEFPADPYVYVLYTYDAPIGGTAPSGARRRTDDPCPSPPGPTSDGCEVSGAAVAPAAARHGMTGTEQVLHRGLVPAVPEPLDRRPRVRRRRHALRQRRRRRELQLRRLRPGRSTSDSPRQPVRRPAAPVGAALAPPTAEGGALRAQDVRTAGDPTGLDGTIIRIDPDTGAAAPGNPLLEQRRRQRPPDRRARPAQPDAASTFRPGTNEIWVGDVGWNTWEEINRVVSPTAGVDNFGWPCYEGADRQSGYDGANLPLCENLYTAGRRGHAARTSPTTTTTRSCAGETLPRPAARPSPAWRSTGGGNYPAGVRRRAVLRRLLPQAASGR